MSKQRNLYLIFDDFQSTFDVRKCEESKHRPLVKVVKKKLVREPAASSIAISCDAVCPGGGDQVQAGATGHGHHAAPSQHHPLCWPSLAELCCTGACFTLLCKKINTFLSSLSLNLRNNFALSTCDVLWWVCAAVECCWVLLSVVECCCVLLYRHLPHRRYKIVSIGEELQ